MVLTQSRVKVERMFIVLFDPLGNKTGFALSGRDNVFARERDGERKRVCVCV